MANEMTLDEKIAIIEQVAGFSEEHSAAFCRKLLSEAWEIEQSGGNQNVANFYRNMATFSMMPKTEQQRWIGRLEGMKSRLEEFFDELKKGLPHE